MALKSRLQRVFCLALPGLFLILASIACDLQKRMPELVDSQDFVTAAGTDHNWSSQVNPGEKYEIRIYSTKLDYTGGFLVLWAVNGVDCADCLLSASGHLDADGIRVVFIAPDSGRLRIQATIRDGYYDAAIEIRQLP